MRKKYIQKEFFCYNKICDKVFKSEKAMDSHNSSIHKGLEGKANCKICGTRFQTEPDVNAHVKAAHTIVL